MGIFDTLAMAIGRLLGGVLHNAAPAPPYTAWRPQPIYQAPGGARGGPLVHERVVSPLDTYVAQYKTFGFVGTTSDEAKAKRIEHIKNSPYYSVNPSNRANPRLVGWSQSLNYRSGRSRVENIFGGQTLLFSKEGRQIKRINGTVIYLDGISKADYEKLQEERHRLRKLIIKHGGESLLNTSGSL